jgi:hypothetical protein
LLNTLPGSKKYPPSIPPDLTTTTQALHTMFLIRRELDGKVDRVKPAPEVRQVPNRIGPRIHSAPAGKLMAVFTAFGVWKRKNLAHVGRKTFSNGSLKRCLMVQRCIQEVPYIM